MALTQDFPASIKHISREKFDAYHIQIEQEQLKEMGFDPEIYNVNGGSISIGHPFGMTGSRLTGHVIRELKRREKKYGIVSMCIGGGMGAAGLFEAC